MGIIRDRRVEGVPALLVEILSPSLVIPIRTPT